MSEHTPGPWGFGNGREGERLILGDNGNGNYVGHVQIHQTPRAMGMWDEEEREANALLISASPKLLAALACAATILERKRLNINESNHLGDIKSILNPLDPDGHWMCLDRQGAIAKDGKAVGS